MAQVHIPGFLSPSFGLSKETRQGCPLPPPLLFYLALEPLVRCLEDTNLITGITVGGQRVTIALYFEPVPVRSAKTPIQCIAAGRRIWSLLGLQN